MLRVAVFGKSKKANEKRVPIHPDQLEWIDPNIRKNLFFEQGYGLHFGLDDSIMESLTGGVLSRAELFETCDIALLAKPTIKDYNEMPEGMIHWGWPHCVQQADITQKAIDQKLTLIAWEAMHRWSEHGDWQMHIFQKNNEIAGYAGIHHAMNLMGLDGNYGPEKKAVVISFGSVSRGAIYALKARGIHNITVFTQRHYFLVADQMKGINYHQFDKSEDGSIISIRHESEVAPLIEDLQKADIIVNGVLQDTDHPFMFVEENEIDQLKHGCLIVDISCDEGMGFPFATPTTFEHPILKVENLYYYGVDHTPAYLWNAASWEISQSLIPYLPILMGGPDTWEASETIRRAIEIKDGIVVNPKILSFQHRSVIYPHERLQ